jgi:hypothetical protein
MRLHCFKEKELLINCKSDFDQWGKNGVFNKDLGNNCLAMWKKLKPVLDESKHKPILAGSNVKRPQFCGLVQKFTDSRKIV